MLFVIRDGVEQGRKSHPRGRHVPGGHDATPSQSSAPCRTVTRHPRLEVVHAAAGQFRAADGEQIAVFVDDEGFVARTERAVGGLHKRREGVAALADERLALVVNDHAMSRPVECIKEPVPAGESEPKAPVVAVRSDPAIRGMDLPRTAGAGVCYVEGIGTCEQRRPAATAELVVGCTPEPAELIVTHCPCSMPGDKPPFGSVRATIRGTDRNVCQTVAA